jgi:hypothetical protein
MRTLCLLALLGCGSNHDASIDAAKQIDAKPIDARPIDAPADALFDAPMAPAGAHRYVIDHQHLPTNSNEARTYGLDLNNDGNVDNQLGMVNGTLVGMGFLVQPVLDHAIDTGSIEMLADLEAADLTTAAQATFTLFDGANAMPAPCNGSSDTTCRHHLAGTATFDVLASPHDPPLAGAIAAGVVTAGPGTLHLRTSVFGSLVDLKLIGARIKLGQVSDASIMTGVIAGAITQDEIDTSVYPPLQTTLTAEVALDCNALTSPPSCGCTSGSTGSTVISLFDTNHDCAVSLDEIKTNSLITALLAPDVTIDAMPALSVGVGISAVHAAFTP